MCQAIRLLEKLIKIKGAPAAPPAKLSHRVELEKTESCRHSKWLFICCVCLLCAARVDMIAETFAASFYPLMMFVSSSVGSVPGTSCCVRPDVPHLLLTFQGRQILNPVASQLALTR